MLEQKVTELIEKIEQAVPEIGGKAIEYGLWDTFYAGIQNLVIGVLALLITVQTVLKTWRHIASVRERVGDSFDFFCDISPAMMFPVSAVMAFSVVALFNLCNIWNWVAVFDTERALVHRIIEKLL